MRYNHIKFKKIREKRGETPEHLAGLLNTTVTNYKMKENGRRRFFLKDIYKLVDILKLTDNEILDIFFSRENEEIKKEIVKMEIPKIEKRYKYCFTKTALFEIAVLMKVNLLACYLYFFILDNLDDNNNAVIPNKDFIIMASKTNKEVQDALIYLQDNEFIKIKKAAYHTTYSVNTDKVKINIK